MELTDNFHIGHHIKQVFHTMPKHCTADWLAAQLHCDRRNVYRIFEKSNLDLALIAKLSLILDHDFFNDLSKQLFSEPPASDAEDERP